MTKRVAKRKGPKFRVGQVGVVAGQPLRIISRRWFDGQFWYTDDRDGMEWSERELRPLTARERGGK